MVASVSAPSLSHPGIAQDRLAAKTQPLQFNAREAWLRAHRYQGFQPTQVPA